MFYVSRHSEKEWIPISDGLGNRVPYRPKDLVRIVVRGNLVDVAMCKQDGEGVFSPHGGVMHLKEGTSIVLTDADKLCYRHGEVYHGLAKEFHWG